MAALLKWMINGLWIAFIGLIILYWNAMSTSENIASEIEALNTKVAASNSEIDRLRYELKGPSGCRSQVDFSKKDMQSKLDGLSKKEKELAQKKSAVVKAQEDLKNMKAKHSKVKREYEDKASKLGTSLNSTCATRLSEVIANCNAESSTGHQAMTRA